MQLAIRRRWEAPLALNEIASLGANIFQRATSLLAMAFSKRIVMTEAPLGFFLARVLPPHQVLGSLFRGARAGHGNGEGRQQEKGTEP